MSAPRENAKPPRWEEGGLAETTKKFRPPTSTAARRSNQEFVATSDTGAIDLVAKLDAARHRLDRSTELLGRALDISQWIRGEFHPDDDREHIHQLDRDVATLKRDVAAYKWRRA